MKPTEIIDKCLADPIHANCKKFLISLEGGSNGKCTQVPKHGDIEEISRQSGHDISVSVNYRYISFYDVVRDAITYFVQRD